MQLRTLLPLLLSITNLPKENTSLYSPKLLNILLSLWLPLSISFIWEIASPPKCRSLPRPLKIAKEKVLKASHCCSFLFYPYPLSSLFYSFSSLPRKISALSDLIYSLIPDSPRSVCPYTSLQLRIIKVKKVKQVFRILV